MGAALNRAKEPLSTKTNSNRRLKVLTVTGGVSQKYASSEISFTAPVKNVRNAEFSDHKDNTSA